MSYKLLLDEIVGAPTINEHENGVADNVSDEADRFGRDMTRERVQTDMGWWVG